MPLLFHSRHFPQKETDLIGRHRDRRSPHFLSIGYFHQFHCLHFSTRSGVFVALRCCTMVGASLFDSYMKPWGNPYFHFIVWFEPDVLSLSLVLIPPHPRLPLSPSTEPLLPPKVNILVCRGSQAASPLIIHLIQGW